MMRRRLGTTTVIGLLLAGIAAGGPAQPASATVPNAAPRKAHKPAGSTGTHATATTTSTKTKGTTSKTKTGVTVAHTPAGKSSTRTTKSTRGAKSSRRSRRVKGQAAPTPERINEIQDALARNGAYTDAPSGKWDDSTSAAMKKFQATHGLNPSGKLDAPTLQRLGFGSQTAGMGAPTPPPNSAANRLLSPAAKRDEAKEESDPQ